MRELVSRLPPQLRLSWASYKINSNQPSLVAFADWINGFAVAASSVTPYASGATRKSARPKSLNLHEGETDAAQRGEPCKCSCRGGPTTGQDKTGEHVTSCVICTGSCESVPRCKRFLDSTRERRWSYVDDKLLCKVCLEQHHGNCSKRCTVSGCRFRHHKLLHNYERNQGPKNSESRGGSTAEESHLTHNTNIPSTLFRILPITLRNGSRKVDTFALLDEGSSVTLMEDDIANALGLTGPVRPLRLLWTGKTERRVPNSRCISISVSAATKKAKIFHMNDVRTVRDLDLPRQTLNMKSLEERYRHLQGIPISSYDDVQPRILIGANNCHPAVARSVKDGEHSAQPIAVKCRLGWSVYGSCERAEANSCGNLNIHTLGDEDDVRLDQMMQRFLAVEDELPTTANMSAMQSNDERRAQMILEATTRRVGERYETGLLWKRDDIQLPDSRPRAKRRLKSFERKLQKDAQLREHMSGQIQLYRELGYIRKLTPEEGSTRTKRTWYIPVFLVRNPNKPGKVRMVMDSAASVNGVSLNSVLLKGPDFLPPLTTPLLRFRQKRFAVTGDLVQMFHQVVIRREDQDAQRFLWRESPCLPIDEYVMERMTFGTTCSPSAAQFVKNKNAEEFRHGFPQAYHYITECTYADDTLYSCDTAEDAIAAAKDIQHVSAGGGFQFHNWISNSDIGVGVGVGGRRARRYDA